MNSETDPAQNIEWRNLLMGLFLLAGAGITLLFSVFLLFIALSMSATIGDDSTLLSMLILSVGTAGLALLLVPGIFLNFRSVFHLFTTWSDRKIRIPDGFLFPLIFLVWPICLMLGQVASGNHRASAFIIPFANIIAIGLPILLYIRISLRGLELPGAKRGWSVFGCSLLISPILALILEAFAVVLILLAYLAYSSTVPGLTDSIQNLTDFIKSGNASQSDAIRLASGLAYAPGAIPALLLTFSVAIPLIEETVKVAAIGLYLGRLRRPVDGFVLGILCGAAFALTENLGFASAGAADWAASAAARATSALPHIFNSGLLGWALVCAWRQGRYKRLVGTFLAVILIHGTWNAISLGIAFSEFSAYVANGSFLFQNSYPWYAGWGMLVLGTLFGLLFNNRQIRNMAALEEKKAGV